MKPNQTLSPFKSVNTTKLVPIFMVLVAIVSIQFGSSLSVLLAAKVGPFGVTLLRTGFTCLFLWLWLKPYHSFPKGRALVLVATYGVVLALMNLSFIHSIELIPVGPAVAIEFLGPLGLATLVSKRLFDFACVGLAAIGLWILMGQNYFSAHSAGLDRLGVAYAAFAGLMWALYIVLGRQIGRYLDPLQSVAHGHLISFGLLMCFMIWVPMPNLFTLDTLLWGGLVALVASLIPYSLEMVALKSVRTQTFSLFMALEPVIAAVMGFLVLHQVLKWHQIVAMIMIMVAASLSAILSPSTAKN